MKTEKERAIAALTREINSWSDETIDDFIRPVLDIPSRPQGNKPYGWLLPQNNIVTSHLITYEHLTKCLPHARKADIDLFFDPLNQAFVEFEVNSNIRIAAFIAQVAHESGSLRYKEEIASGKAYEGRRDLGNVYPGDGLRYKGRGIIQLTGRHNYNWASRHLKIDLVANPERAKEPIISSGIACLYWKSRGLNEYADINTKKAFREITRKINGGYNGWEDRLKHWNIAKKVLL